MKSSIVKLNIIFLNIILNFSFVFSQNYEAIKHPNILREDAKSIFLYWDIEKELFQSTSLLSNLTHLNAYKDSITSYLGPTLLQKRIHKEHRVHQNNAFYDQDTLSNFELIHNGFCGRIEHINPITAEILNFQCSRYPMFSHPTEFHAFILFHSNLNTYRVYFASSDQPWPPKPTFLIEFIEKDLSNDWALIQHLHNHYSDAEEFYLGRMAPSKSDVHYFKILKERFNISEAIITNGFSSLFIPADCFSILHSN